MEQIVIAVLGSGVLSAVIAGVFTLISNHQNNKKQNIDERFNELEMNDLRTQLIVLIKLSPNEHSEILKVAEAYFGRNGDWICTPMFNNWLIEQKLGEPEWFNSKGE